MTDIIQLNLNFKIDKHDIDELIDALNKSIIFKQCLDKDELCGLEIVKLLHNIPKKYITKDKLYNYYLRKRGYAFRRNKFEKELYYLNIYGLIDMFTDNNITYVKNITKDHITLDITKHKTR